MTFTLGVNEPLCSTINVELKTMSHIQYISHSFVNYAAKMVVFAIAIYVYTVTISSATTQHCHNETGRCFWLATGSGSWDAGRTACLSEGGDLAVLETEELYDFINSGILR